MAEETPKESNRQVKIRLQAEAQAEVAGAAQRRAAAFKKLFPELKQSLKEMSQPGYGVEVKEAARIKLQEKLTDPAYLAGKMSGKASNKALCQGQQRARGAPGGVDLPVTVAAIG